MDKILEYLKTYNERHPEYDGMASVVFYDDGTGHLNNDNNEYIGLTSFSGLDQFKIVCETE